MIKKSLMYGAMLGACIALLGCETLEKTGSEFMHRKGVDVFKTKQFPVPKKCFYQVGRPDFPAELSSYKESETGERYPEIQYTVFEFDQNGDLRRLASPRNLDALDQAVLSGNADEIAKEFNNFSGQDRASYNYTDDELNISKSAGLLANPLDIRLHWYSKQVFIVLNDNYRFDVADPFNVAVGNPHNISPFYDDIKSYQNGKMIVVDYLSLPKRKNIVYDGFDYIEGRYCKYAYELNLFQKYTDARTGEEFESRIIIDPGGEGDGDPPAGHPPRWP